METVKIEINVDKTMAIKAGKSTYGHQIVVLSDADLAQFNAEERELLAACPFKSDMKILELRTQDSRVGYMVSPPPVAEATPDAVRYQLIGLEKNILDEVESIQRQHDENLAAWVEEVKAARLDRCYNIHTTWLKYDLVVPGYLPKVNKSELLVHPALAEKWAEAAKAAQSTIDRLAKEQEEKKERDAAAEAEKARKESDRIAQLTTWVKEHGTESQLKRQERGLLPESEILAAIRAQVFAPLADWPTYEKLTNREIWAAYDVDEEDEPEVTYDVWLAEDLTAEEFERLEEAERLIPGCKAEVFVHRGRLDRTSEDEDEECQIIRKSLKVTVTLGEITIGRRFAL